MILGNALRKRAVRPYGIVRPSAADKSADDDDDDDEIAYFTVRWKTRASFVYSTKNTR